jgi:hypothetical protein
VFECVKKRAGGQAGEREPDRIRARQTDRQGGGGGMDLLEDACMTEVRDLPCVCACVCAHVCACYGVCACVCVRELTL